MNQKNKKWIVGLIATFGCVPLFAAEAPTRGTVRTHQHCVTTATPESDISGEQESNSIECYGSFSEAILAATNGAVRLPSGESMSAALDHLEIEIRRLELQEMESGLTDPRVGETIPSNSVGDLEQNANSPVRIAAGYVIAVDYEHPNYGGSSMTWSSNAPCSTTVSYRAPTMPSGWNDIISSTRSYSNCIVNRLYENTYYSGAVRTCGTTCPYVGAAMNDRTSSRKWSYSACP